MFRSCVLWCLVKFAEKLSDFTFCSCSYRSRSYGFVLLGLRGLLGSGDVLGTLATFVTAYINVALSVAEKQVIRGRRK